MMVTKKNFKLAAGIKTMADYALVLQYVNGYEKNNAIESAMASQEEPLFKKLLERNIELFKTGDITMM